MNAHMSGREFNLLSLGGPVGDSALQAVGVAAHLKMQNEKQKGVPSLAMCSQGEGTTQQGEFLEALTLSIKESLPMAFSYRRQ